jgi:hypothetical protein
MPQANWRYDLELEMGRYEVLSSVLGSTLALIWPNAEVTQGVPSPDGLSKTPILEGPLLFACSGIHRPWECEACICASLLIDGVLRLCLEASSSVFGLCFMHKPRVYSAEVLVPVAEHRPAERLMHMCPSPWSLSFAWEELMVMTSKNPTPRPAWSVLVLANTEATLPTPATYLNTPQSALLPRLRQVMSLPRVG